MRTLAAVLAVLAVTCCAGSGNVSQPTPSPIAAATPTPIPAIPTPSPLLATPGGPTADNSAFKFTRIASGLQSPLYLTDAGDGSGRLFIVEQAGRIRVVKNGSLLPAAFLDIRSLVESGGERGLLSVAFHPQFR